MVEYDKEQCALLASLFAYPAQPWLDIKKLRQIINEPFCVGIRQQIESFLDYAEQRSLEQLAEEYVMNFDFSENSNLDLTSLLCPDDRKRGPVLANLKSIYQKAQLAVDSNELPDYLPMVLEFLSVSDSASGREVMGIVGPGMEKLWEELKRNNSPYAPLLEACLASTGPMKCSGMNAPGGVS